MCRQYRSMLSPGPEVQPDAVYCCVKSFVRDVGLQQPPLLCLRPEHLLRLGSLWPEEILERQPLKKGQIEDIVKLSRLCQDKYEMPGAAAALQAYLTERNYSVPALTWLQRLGLDLCNCHDMCPCSCWLGRISPAAGPETSGHLTTAAGSPFRTCQILRIACR